MVVAGFAMIAVVVVEEPCFGALHAQSLHLDLFAWRKSAVMIVVVVLLRGTFAVAVRGGVLDSSSGAIAAGVAVDVVVADGIAAAYALVAVVVVVDTSAFARLKVPFAGEGHIEDHSHIAYVVVAELADAGDLVEPDSRMSAVRAFRL